MKIYIVMLLLLLASACGQSVKVTRTELLSYVNDKDNNLVQEKDVNGINVQIFYKPSSLLVAQELNKSTALDTAFVSKLESKYRSQLYFILKISSSGKEAIRQVGNMDNYSTMLQVLAFDMQKHINLVTGNDTVPVSDYYFDQTYGMGSANNILLSFDKNKLSNSSFFDIRINEFGLATGNLSFRFKASDLEKLPKLDYSSAY